MGLPRHRRRRRRHRPREPRGVRAALPPRAEAAGCPALVLTVDLQARSNRETVVRGRRADARDCSSCHAVDPFDTVGAFPHRPMFRGTDVFKALASGATAVCIGRPYVWRLAAFGPPGVEAALDILHRELQLVMRQAGTARLSQIDWSYPVDRGRS